MQIQNKAVGLTQLVPAVQLLPVPQNVPALPSLWAGFGEGEGAVGISHTVYAKRVSAGVNQVLPQL